MGEVDLVAEVRENHREIESDLGNQCGTCHDLWPCAEIRLADAYDRLREALEEIRTGLADTYGEVTLNTLDEIACAALHTNDGDGTNRFPGGTNAEPSDSETG
jgi:hypothetical protein